MNTTYTFSADDSMNPVYCKQCRIHIPLAVSTQGSGTCPDCLQSNQQAHTAALNQQQAMQAKQAAAQQQLAAARTRVRAFLPYFVWASLILGVVFGVMLKQYHDNNVVPIKNDLVQTRSDLTETKRQLAQTQEELASLTRVVNHNADAANHNNSLRW